MVEFIDDEDKTILRVVSLQKNRVVVDVIQNGDTIQSWTFIPHEDLTDKIIELNEPVRLRNVIWTRNIRGEWSEFGKNDTIHPYVFSVFNYVLEHFQSEYIESELLNE